MDLRSTHAYWPIKNGLIRDYPVLTEDVVCDVAVIGGGITGALMAYHLAEAGAKVIVLDSRYVGWGSTSATTALLQYEIDTPLSELADMVGEDHAVRSYKACRDAIDKIACVIQKLDSDCDFERKQSLYLASGRRDVRMLKEEHAIRNAHGIPVDWLDASSLAKHYSIKRLAALRSDDGAQVDAYQLTHQLLRKAVQMGARVYSRTTVTHYDYAAGVVSLDTDQNHVVQAAKTVFATGYESQRYLKKPVAKLISTYALVSEPIAREMMWPSECLIWESAHPYLYLRTTSGDQNSRRIIVGGEDERFQNALVRDKLIPRKTDSLVRKFRKLFPRIELEVAFAWAGTFGETKDGLAYIGDTGELPGAYFALGYGGNGITYSMLAAEIIRDAILGRNNAQAELFRFDR